MTRMMLTKKRWLFAFTCALLLAASHQQDRLGIGKEICDDGKYHVGQDIGDKNEWKCNGDHLVIKEYDLPAGVQNCSSAELEDGGAVCMSESIQYDHHVPSSGSYRPLPPAYGEYSYLPPQRWLHALKFGAIAFLYHPCAPKEQVAALRSVAWSCLRKYVMTPYPHLSIDKPLAMVSWGCVYSMTWVHKHTAKEWVKQHALNTSDSQVITDGQYEYGLIDRSVIVSTLDDSDVCPKEVFATITDSPSTNSSRKRPDLDNGGVTQGSGGNSEASTSASSPTEAASTLPTSEDPDTNSPCKLNTTTSCNQLTVTVFIHAHPILTGITIAIMLIALTIVGLLLWTCVLRRGQGRRRGSGRYKSVSHFFPKGAAGEVRITIPELGTPKAMSSEREKLLLVESDEDEL